MWRPLSLFIFCKGWMLHYLIYKASALHKCDLIVFIFLFFSKLGTSILQIMIWTTGDLITLLWQPITVWCVHMCKCCFTWYIIHIFLTYQFSWTWLEDGDFDFVVCIFDRAKLLNPEWVELHASRGYESHTHKLFMRATGRYSWHQTFISNMLNGSIISMS